MQSGRLQPPLPDAEAEAFVPWFASIEEESFVLKYTPVHAAAIAAVERLPGPDRLALGVIAAAQVFAVAALAAEIGVGGAKRALAAGLFAFSPLVLQLDITYLPYGTSLVLGVSALTLALRGARIGSAWSAIAAGLVWGVAFFARPYDGLLFLLVIAVAILGRHGASGLVRAAWLGAAGAVVPVAGLLAFNGAATGDSFQLPFNLLEADDRLGFGERRALPSDAAVDFGLEEALSALGRNLFLVVVWTGGGLVAVALGFWALVRKRVDRAALIALAVVWPIGYAFFWGSYLTAFVWDGALFLGPYYYLPLVVVVSTAAAVGLADLHRIEPRAAAAALAGMVVLSLAVILPALNDQLDRSSQRVEMAQALESEVTEPAVVFLPPVYGPYLQNPFSFLRNTPMLDDPVVYALSRSEAEDENVLDMFPRRNAYRVELPRGWSDQPDFDPVIEISQLDE